jgi:hypothetical protein
MYMYIQTYVYVYTDICLCIYRHIHMYMLDCQKDINGVAVDRDGEDALRQEGEPHHLAEGRHGSSSRQVRTRPLATPF